PPYRIDELILQIGRVWLGALCYVVTPQACGEVIARGDRGMTVGELFGLDSPGIAGEVADDLRQLPSRVADVRGPRPQGRLHGRDAREVSAAHGDRDARARPLEIGRAHV